MSKTIDQRVVEMQFDNKQFEKDISTSMSSIDKLKQRLNFDGATKGLENVESAAKKCNMSSLGDAVEAVRLKFSALEVMGVTALANLTNSAVNAGKRIVSALTIDPIKTGFLEYETQINAVQTILANTQSKGTTLTDVNAALDELNKYADQTIYNFTEMTRNIGTFTAAGVDLDKSVTSIKGIANLAAVSGSNAQQASTAMYQLSQALAAGKVSLMDWNSVVNAGMGGQLFQDALKRTATQMGHNVDAMIEKYGSFRESLTQGGWLTAEVLTETLTQLSGAYTEADLIAQGYSESQAKEIAELAQTAVDAATKVKTFTQLWDTLKEAAQSGWTQTWEILVGDFEEAKDFLTELSETFGEVINSSAESRNALLYDTMTSNWKKVTDGITEAGLSAEDFKTKVEEVAKSQGVNVDELVADYGSLEAAFKNGAISSDILNQALLKMTGTSEEISKKQDELRGKYKTNKDLLDALTKAGYEHSDIQELITKDTEGQAIALNDLSDAQLMSIGYTAEQVQSIRELSKYAELAGGSLKTFMDNVAVPQGREMLIDSIRVSLRSLISIFESVGKAWRDVFPPMTSDDLYNIVKGFRDFILAIRPSEETLDKLQRTFRGLFSILSIGKEIISAVVRAIGSLIGNFTGLGGGILSVTATIGDWLYNLDQTIKKTDIFNTVFQGIAKAIQVVIDAFKTLINIVKEKFIYPGLEVLNAFLGKFSDRMSQVGNAAEVMEIGVSSSIKAMGSALKNSDFLKLLQTLWEGVKKIGEGIANAFGALTGGLVEKISNADFKGILDIVNTLIAGGIGVGINKFLKSITETFSSFRDVTKGIVNVFDGVRGCLEAYQTNLKADTLLKIAGAIGVLAAAIVVVSLIDSAKLSASLGAITMLFAELMGSMAIFSRLSGTIVGVTKSSAAMIAISVAILILASALKKLGGLNFEELAVGITGVAGLTAIVVKAAKAMRSKSDAIIQGATQMVILAGAIKIMASACEDLSTLSWSELAKGLIGLLGIAEILKIIATTMTTNGKTFIKGASQILVISGAIKLLASVCEELATLSWNELVKGVAGVGSLALILGKFSKTMKTNGDTVIKGAGQMVIAASALLILAQVIKQIGTIDWAGLAKGLIGLSGSMATLVIGLNQLKYTSEGSGSLILAAAALLVLAEALTVVGSMDLLSLATGLTGLGASMAILVVGLNAMNGTLAGSAALLVAATSLAILTPVLKALGGMSWESIAKGLVAIGGALAVIGVAGALLSPIVPAILGLAGAFTLIGIGVLGIGAGLLAAGAGLSAIAVGITALATSLAGGAAAIAAGLAVIITGIVNLIPAIIASIGEGIIELCKVIADGAPAIGEAVKALVLTIIDVLVECVPEIANGALELVVGVLDALVEHTPDIIESIMEFLIRLLEGVAEKLPELIVAAVDVIMAFFAGIVDALKGIDTDTLLKGIVGVGLLAAIMAALSAVAGLVPGAMVGVLGMGAVVAELALVLAAIGALAQIPGLDWLINEGGKLLEDIGVAIGSLVGGIVGGVMSGISGQFPEIGKDLSDFMTNIQPFVEGASKINPSMMDGAKALAETILILTAANILDSLTSWLTGGSSMIKFAEDLVPFGRAMKEFAAEIEGLDASVVQNAAIAGKTLAEMADTIPNSGGVVAFFTGENDMEAFAEDLIPFGKAMKEFSDSISGMDTDAVSNASTAGKALAEMAKTIPNTGGLVAFFAGENDMVEFGNQLVPFGEAMKKFSLSVTGLDPDAITNATTAGKALTALADTIPNTGGLVSFFTGENDMGVFGDQLVAFGEDFAKYAEYVTDVKPSVVTATANAAASLVELANSLPDNKLFVNETTLDEFGGQLSEFGSYFASYYNNVSGINTSQLRSVISEMWRLMDMAQGMDNIDSGAMGDFGKNLTRLGESGVSGFISAFTDATSKVKKAAEAMLNAFINTAKSYESQLKATFAVLLNSSLDNIKSKYSEFTSAGKETMTNLIRGVSSQDAGFKTAVTTIVNKAISSFKERYSEFTKIGEEYMSRLIKGVEKNAGKFDKAFPLSSALKNIRGEYNSFYNAGVYLVTGFADGITSRTWYAESKSKAMARAAAKAAEKELDINSPSKVGYRIGGFFGLGFVHAIDEYADKSYEASSGMANSAKTGLTDAISKINDALDGRLDTNPVIRPVLDLSDVESGTARLNTLFSRNSAVSISKGMSRGLTAEVQNGAETSGAKIVNYLTQNNYSPKSLSRTDIYRQTKNLFSAQERMVKT